MAPMLATLSEQVLPWLDSAFGSSGTTALALLEIMGINILLSGDNAVVIAIACRSLPPQKRFYGILLGVLAAIILRIVFTIGLQSVLQLPWVKLAGGLVLLWIAIKLLLEADDGEKDIASSKTLAGAVWTIAIADVIMSLDNVLAVAGAAHDQPQWVIYFGLAMSIPLIVGGATLIVWILSRFPALVWAGAALLGWIAGELIAGEKFLTPAYAAITQAWGIPMASWPYVCATFGAGIVVLTGAVAQSRRSPRAAVR
jgi:YjbE family integral membrane protein